MKRIIKVLLLSVALFVVFGEANAQPPMSEAAKGKMKIAHVNSSEILDAMPEKVTAEKELEDYYNKLQYQLQTMAQEYQSKVQNYEDNQATMNGLVKQSREKEIIDLQNRIQQFQSNAESQFEAKRSELLKPLLDKIQNAINAVGKEKQCTYILDLATGAAVYVSPNAVDYTKEVMTKLGIK